MKITGELLKSERVNKGLTVLQVAQALKLSSKIISSIESGDQSQLPAKTFVRGFVKSYAEFLKLNPDVVLRQYQEEMGTTSPLPKIPPPNPSSPENFRSTKPSPKHTSQNYSQTKSVTSASIKQQNLEEQNLNNKIIMFLFGAVALVIVIISGNRIFNNEPPTVIPTETEASNVIIPSYDSSAPEATSSTAAASNADVAAQNGVSSTGAADNSGVAATGPALNNTNAASVSATTTASTTGTPAGKDVSGVAAQTPAPAVVEDDMPASAGKPIELIIESKKEVELFYAKGNTKVFKSIKLIPNKVQILRSDSGLHLKSSDGGAFKIIANGVDMGNAGPNNKPVKLSF